MKKYILFVAVILAFFGCADKGVKSTKTADFSLKILHTNDTHAYLAGIDKYGNPSYDESSSRGGYARIAAAIKDRQAKNDNVIALDGGDQFQGSLYYSINKYKIIADVQKYMPWQAMTLGNHEFDEGCVGLKEFMKISTTPVLAANLEIEPSSQLYGISYKPYKIIEIKGQKVGIIGIANDEIKELSKACDGVNFMDARQTLQKYADELEKMGVKHIIALTHLGLNSDKELASSVNNVDIIVGGHSHSYLAKGSKDGEYPLVLKAPNGKPVLVVTAKFAAQYLGELDIVFDEKGLLKSWSGEAKELKNSLPLEPNISKIIKENTSALNEYKTKIIGSHSINMSNSMEECRDNECFPGLLTADAMLEFFEPFGAQIALFNSGAIRSGIPKGQIRRIHVLDTHPFGGSFVLRTYSGEQIIAVLEHGVSEQNAHGVRLLQPAGLIYFVDAKKPVGSRVIKAVLVDKNGKETALNPKAKYKVVLSNYMLSGGDGYDMLEVGGFVSSPKETITNVVESYIVKNSPINEIKKGRINFVK